MLYPLSYGSSWRVNPIRRLRPTLRPVKYVSTRGDAPELDFGGVVLAGLAPDGGLYVPTEIPALPEGWESWGYVDAVAATLELFGAEEPRGLVERAASRFRHPDIAPVVPVGDRRVFELFWGPTFSFKDHALQVLGGLLERGLGARTGVILGATSGDTGSAAIEAVRGRPNMRIVVLYPEGMVSDFQRRQMTTVGDANVAVVAVRGTFDDCQAMVKESFRTHGDLLAFNSINWARVAVQVGYYVYLGATIGEPFDVVVPTGNFGNVYSCWLAKQMGAPIASITIANNANRGLADLVNAGQMTRGPVVATVAPAMDVGLPFQPGAIHRRSPHRVLGRSCQRRRDSPDDRRGIPGSGLSPRSAQRGCLACRLGHAHGPAPGGGRHRPPGQVLGDDCREPGTGRCNGRTLLRACSISRSGSS